MAQYKGLRLSGDRSAFMQGFGNAINLYDKTETITALLALTDTVDMIRLPGGMLLTELESWNPDLCTSGSLVVKVGYRKANSQSSLATVDDAFGSSLSHFQAIVLSSVRTKYVFEPLTFNEDVIVFATVTTAATGAAITTGTISTIARGIARGIK